jgi:hypothetical protein
LAELYADKSADWGFRSAALILFKKAVSLSMPIAKGN